MPNEQTNQSDGYAALAHHIMNGSVQGIMQYTNTECVKCSGIMKHMVRVGCVVFCFKCVDEEFKTSDPIHEERETYLKWLRVKYTKEDAG